MSNSIWQSFLHAQAGTIKFLAVPSIAFLIILPLYFAIKSLLNNGRISLSTVLGQAFPKYMYSGPQARTDAVNWVLNYVVISPLRVLAFLLIGTWITIDVGATLTGWFGPRPQVVHALWAIALFQYIGATLVASFFDYWVHRATHQVPWLWSFHRTHHSVEHLNFFALARVHPIEHFLFFGVAAIGFPLGTQIASYLCGVNASPVNVIVISLVAYARLISFDRLGHSHIPLSFGWLNLIIPGPAVHQIHHSAELRHRDTNFSQNLPFWDFVFGTYYMPKKGETWRCGLTEDELGENNPHQTMRQLYFEPFVHFWSQIRPARR